MYTKKTRPICYRTGDFIDLAYLPPCAMQDSVVPTPMKLVDSKQFRGIADTAVGKALTSSQIIWRQIRSPFLLPVGGCGTCVEWEAIEYGKQGCLRCGLFHICCITTCPTVEIENNSVCTVTGSVVRSITYDLSEYLTTGTHEINEIKKGARLVGGAASGTGQPRNTKIQSNPINKKYTVSRCINYHQRVCLQVLCSSITKRCNEKEQLKLSNRLRWSMMKHVRSFKLAHGNKSPNCIVLISKIAADIENYRLPVTNNTDSIRKQLAYLCATDIFKFTCSMVQSNALFTMNLDPMTMVIGLLYLLRSGLVHKNMTVLPRHRLLSYLLPPENYVSMFGVKSKIITEAENIIKCHLRTLSDTDIKEIGYEAFDHLVN
jgi:hypothetical protein